MRDDYILERLMQGGTVSGETLSEEMGISRAAVWKGILRLREDGWQIDDTNVRLTDNSSPAPKYCAMTTDTPVVTPSASDEYRYVATPATLTADSATSPRYRPTTYASTKLYMR